MTQYYVTKSGNNSWTGRYETPQNGDGPWLTIQKAADNLVAGDAVQVNAGTYNETIQETTGGIYGSPITYLVKTGDTVTVDRWQITGQYVKIDGFIATYASCNWQGTVYINANYCELLNCIIQDSKMASGAGHHAVLLYTSSSNCIVDNCTIRRCDNQAGMICGTNHIISNNDISDMRNSGGAAPDGFHFFNSGHIFRGNYFHDFDFANMSGGPHVDMFQTWDDNDGIGTDVTIEKNFVYLPNFVPASSGAAARAVMMNKGTNISIINNIFFVHQGFIQDVVTASGLKVYNNTFMGDLTWDETYAPSRAMSFENTANTDIRNNIIVDYPDRHINILSGNSNLTCDYNCKYNSDDSTPGGQGEQANDVWKEDPKFFNTQGNLFSDYRLMGDSPCIGAGATLLDDIRDDYDDKRRPRGHYFDMGALEHQGPIAGEEIKLEID